MRSFAAVCAVCAFPLVALLPDVARAQSTALGEQCERFVASPARAPQIRAALQTTAAGPEAAAAAFAEGCLAVAGRRWDAAARAFERAVQANDRSAVARYWLGRTYGLQVIDANVLRQASLARKTKAALESAVQLDPNHLEARAALMQYYLRAPGFAGGSVDKAREQVAEVRRRNAYRGGLLAATVARRENRYAEAIGEYERLIAQHPDSVAPYSSTASTYGDQQRWDDAFRAVDRFVAAHPDAVLAQYAIGRAAAESGQQLARGEQALKRYIAVATPTLGEPTVATAYLRLGAIHERRGDREAARAAYRKAIDLEPTLLAARTALSKLR